MKTDANQERIAAIEKRLNCSQVGSEIKELAFELLSIVGELQERFAAEVELNCKARKALSAELRQAEQDYADMTDFRDHWKARFEQAEGVIAKIGRLPRVAKIDLTSDGGVEMRIRPYGEYVCHCSVERIINKHITKTLK